MKTIPYLVGVAALCAACGDDAKGTSGSGAGGGPSGSGGATSAGGATGSGGSGGALGTPGPGSYQPDYATSSDYFTRMSQPADSGSVHGTVRIWYSANIMDLPTDGPFTVPEGTVAVKEEYNASNQVFIKVVMIKQAAGYDPANNDWYYEARNPDDTIANDPVPGKPNLCISCHSDGAITDYLLGFDIAS
ncbi:MAG: hypothetical protein R3B72_37530 [Polyangiaceae bacterium]